MPTSQYNQLNQIVELVSLTKPKKLLDIGVGFGKYGYLSREYLELWYGSGTYGQWTVQIDGIEACEKYLTPVHDFVYDRVHIGNAVEVLPTLETRYDLVLIVDVLEHFSHADGMRLLTLCQAKAENILVSVPKTWWPQGAAFGNDYEIHRFHWGKRHFKPLGDIHFLYNCSSIICYIGPRGHDVLRRCNWNRGRRRLIHAVDLLGLRGLAYCLAGYMGRRRAARASR